MPITALKIAGIWVVFALVGCSTATESEPVRLRQKRTEKLSEMPKREQAQAEALLRLIYYPEDSGYKLRFSPERDSLKQKVSTLKERLRKIRESEGDIGFRLAICGKYGEELVERLGTLDRKSQQIRYDVSEDEYLEQPVRLWVEFLDWYDDRSVISFTEVGSNPLTAEHFVITHGEKTFHMTISGMYIID